MNEVKALPCHRALDAECFEAHPESARQLFAIKLLYTLFPGEITRRLMKLLGINLVELLARFELPIDDLQAAEAAADQAQAVEDQAQAELDRAYAAYLQAYKDWIQAQADADQAQRDADAAATQDKAAAQDAADQAQAAADQAKADAAQAKADAAQARADAKQARADAADEQRRAAAAQARATATDPPPPAARKSGVVPGTLIELWSPGPPKRPTPSPGGAVTISVPPTTADGYIRNSHSTWQLAHDAPEGDTGSRTTTSYGGAVLSYNMEPAYGMIRRTLLYFSLAQVPAGSSILAATLSVRGCEDALANVCVQAADPSDPWILADYTSFKDPVLGIVTWTLDRNRFVLGQDGWEHIQDNAGGVVAFCLREYDHDYLDVKSDYADYKCAGMYFAEDGRAAYIPRLEVTFI